MRKSALSTSCWSIWSETTWAKYPDTASVKVEDFMVIEYYSHVMHIVSEVVGEFAEGKDAYDVLRRLFREEPSQARRRFARWKSLKSWSRFGEVLHRIDRMD